MGLKYTMQLILLMPLSAGPILQYFLNTRTYRYTYQIKSEQSRSEGINRYYLVSQALEALEINAPTEASNVLEGQVYTGVVKPGTAAVTSDYFCSAVLTTGTRHGQDTDLLIQATLRFGMVMVCCRLWILSYLEEYRKTILDGAFLFP